MRLRKVKNTFDITIGQYQQFCKVENPTDIDIVSIFYNLDKDAVNLISHKQVTQLANEIKEILNSEHKHILKWNDLGFEPDLDNMTTNAFGDAITYAQSIDTAHLFTAVLYRPIKKRWLNFTKRYEVKEYTGTHNIRDKAKDLPLALFLGANAFFLTLRKDFTIAIQNRFQAKSKQLKANLNKSDLNETGDLLSHFMQLLEEISISSSMKLEKNQFVK